MTRRGLFKMLAATPLAGIVAKLAPKYDHGWPTSWQNPDISSEEALDLHFTMDEFQKAYIDPAVEHWTRIPGEICNCGRCKGGVWYPFESKIGDTLTLKTPSRYRANIQS